MAESKDPIIIGFIVTVVIIGLIGGITLSVFLCMRWRDYKRRQLVAPASRQTRRRRTIRVLRANNHNANQSNLDQFTAEPPPPYSEHDTLNPSLHHVNLDRIHQLRDHGSRGHTRGSLGIGTPARSSRSSSVARNSLFSVHINTGNTNTPSMTPAGRMFNSEVF